MYKKILVPLDGSDFSACSLEHVTAVASGCNVPEVVLLQVMETFYAQGGVRSMLGEEAIVKAEKQEKENIETYLKGIAQDLNKSGINVDTVVLTGPVADTILDYVRDENVDLIIMSTHGRSGIVRWALSSVADKIIRSSPVPVLMVAPKACRI